MKSCRREKTNSAGQLLAREGAISGERMWRTVELVKQLRWMKGTRTEGRGKGRVR